ncbi:hypothetical protein CVS40_2967 [Lucilia cuprina]|nr:hypothetical protein CVS40_2967 [Lucilia cuprina]
MTRQRSMNCLCWEVCHLLHHNVWIFANELFVGNTTRLVALSSKTPTETEKEEKLLGLKYGLQAKLLLYAACLDLNFSGDSLNDINLLGDGDDADMLDNILQEVQIDRYIKTLNQATNFLEWNFGR